MYKIYSDQRKEKKTLQQTNSSRYIHLVTNHITSARTKENTAVIEPSNFKLQTSMVHPLNFMNVICAPILNRLDCFEQN